MGLESATELDMGEKLLVAEVSWWKVKAQWATVTLDARKLSLRRTTLFIAPVKTTDIHNQNEICASNFKA